MDFHTVRNGQAPNPTTLNYDESSNTLDKDRMEETMLWDAQTALLSHDLDRAREIYTRAALPPHRSSQAALALFNLAHADLGGSPPRNVDKVNQAAAWLVVGIYWILLSGGENGPATRVASSDEEDEGLVIPRKQRSGTTTAKPSRETSGDDVQPSVTASASTSDTSSYTLETPALSSVVDRPVINAKAILGLLTPLLELYKLGKIQQTDPVVSHPELAKVLRPLGSNVYKAGAKVVQHVLAQPLINQDPKGKKAARSSGDIDPQIAVRMIASYIAGMTSSAHEASTAHFQQVIHYGPCGSSDIDDLMKHSEKRLLAIPFTPTPTSPKSYRSPSQGFPFPSVNANAKRLRGHPSTASIFSCASSFYARSRLLNTPVKSDAALVKLSIDEKLLDKPEVYKGKRDAKDLLRKSTVDLKRLREKAVPNETGSTPSPSWLPSWGSWLSSSKPIKAAQIKEEALSTPLIPENAPTPPVQAPRIPTIDQASISKSHSSPVLSAFNTNLSPPPLRTHRSSTILRKSLPFEPKPEDAINSIDPTLAAAELASTLTKKAVCDVCRDTGVNFPNCRKCGLTFCSRPCRVDRSGAGDGRRHICGAWESRKLLTVPVLSPTSRRGPPLVAAS